MSTTSATEAARRPDGELDPANAGLGEPEATLPTWEDALAHAEVLRAQGVEVSISEHRMAILVFGTNGDYHDPADGTPARRDFYPDGTLEWVCHYTNGELNDPADGTPAWQGFRQDGTLEWAWHYANGELVGRETFPPPTGEA